MNNIRNMFTNIQREKFINTFRISGLNTTTNKIEEIIVVKKNRTEIGTYTHPLFTNEQILSIMCKNDHIAITKLIMGE